MPDSGSRRGRTHDAEGAREAILNAAEEVFAEHGFDGARIDAIAATAGYNKSLIFQYFGDKLNLYAEVIKRADEYARELQTLAVAALPIDEAELTPEKFAPLLKAFLAELFDFFNQYPRIRRIFLWEMAEGWQTYSKIVAKLGTDDIVQFSPLLDKLQRVGLLRADMNPLVQIMMAEFLYMQFLASLPLMQIFLPGEDLTSEQALDQARTWLGEFVTRGLLAKS